MDRATIDTDTLAKIIANRRRYAILEYAPLLLDGILEDVALAIGQDNPHFVPERFLEDARHGSDE